jgi:Glycosyl-transferase for dystroglycan
MILLSLFRFGRHIRDMPAVPTRLHERSVWISIRNMASRRTLAWLIVLGTSSMSLQRLSLFPDYYYTSHEAAAIHQQSLAIINYTGSTTTKRMIRSSVVPQSAVQQVVELDTIKALDDTEKTTTAVVTSNSNNEPAFQNASLLVSVVPSLSPATTTTTTAAATATNEQQYNFQRHFEDAPRCLQPRLEASQIGFTLVTQTSLDRLWIMEYQCARWKGPISLAVFVASDDDDPLYNNDTTTSVATADSIRNDLVQSKNCSADLLSVRLVDD